MKRRFTAGVFPTGVGVNRCDPGAAQTGAVFPTGVGVNRAQEQLDNLPPGIPHRRGGEPSRPPLPSICPAYSPQAWG